MEPAPLIPEATNTPVLCIKTSTYEDFKADRLKPELL
jgi:hypothetical protein